jgi:hypothetical protein
MSSSTAYIQTHTLLTLARHTNGLPSRAADENLVKVGKHTLHIHVVEFRSGIQHLPKCVTFIPVRCNISELVRVNYRLQHASIYRFLSGCGYIERSNNVGVVDSAQYSAMWVQSAVVGTGIIKIHSELKTLCAQWFDEYRHFLA